MTETGFFSHTEEFSATEAIEPEEIVTPGSCGGAESFSAGGCSAESEIPLVSPLSSSPLFSHKSASRTSSLLSPAQPQNRGLAARITSRTLPTRRSATSAAPVGRKGYWTISSRPFQVPKVPRPLRSALAPARKDLPNALGLFSACLSESFSTYPEIAQHILTSTDITIVDKLLKIRELAGKPETSQEARTQRIYFKILFVQLLPALMHCAKNLSEAQRPIAFERLAVIARLVEDVSADLAAQFAAGLRATLPCLEERKAISKALLERSLEHSLIALRDLEVLFRMLELSAEQISGVATL